MKYKCQCCGYFTFDNKPDGSYDICTVCFWEDDPIPLEDPTYEGGAIGHARNQYSNIKKIFKTVYNIELYTKLFGKKIINE